MGALNVEAAAKPQNSSRKSHVEITIRNFLQSPVSDYVGEAEGVIIGPEPGRARAMVPCDAKGIARRAKMNTPNHA